ncbi:hypothetical protein DUNSADRAFT_953 [Dunaliella salina]|uniref:RRM domain-containing protein n=1 Tax=Dunaliella salina TaxID=3046 RepID=A0ABQ7GXT9_DUNSA|nr:hypothetical protein DUNSADRAFT_953 [Dunaliella salina]|eukprot:KAF5839382.1 hypothetical protein DUNSADRAFT_953 [Dunaliella salina]
MEGNEMQEVKIGKRVFVGNLAWRTSWQDLKDKFRECGNVVYANVMRDDDDRSKGWGIVEFETPDELVVRGIPWSYTWKELKDMFAEVAGVERADVVYGDDGRSRGYGTVRFSSPEEAQAALQAFNGRDCEGRALFVFFDKYA